MPGRTSGDYRYGFNGKEKDKDGEIGSLTHYDYGFRIYNPGIGRFLSVDPLTKKYPSWTPYAFAMNRVIDGVDLDGLEYANATEGVGPVSQDYLDDPPEPTWETSDVNGNGVIDGYLPAVEVTATRIGGNKVVNYQLKQEANIPEATGALVHYKPRDPNIPEFNVAPDVNPTEKPPKGGTFVQGTGSFVFAGGVTTAEGIATDENGGKVVYNSTSGGVGLQLGVGGGGGVITSTNGSDFNVNNVEGSFFVWSFGLGPIFSITRSGDFNPKTTDGFFVWSGDKYISTEVDFLFKVNSIDDFKNKLWKWKIGFYYGRGETYIQYRNAQAKKTMKKKQ